MENVLITGGAGFIGSNFVRWLLRAEPEVRIVNLDALTYAGSLENLQQLSDPGRHTFVRGDINDGLLVEHLLRKHQIETLVHFAAESHVDRSILGPAPFVQTNIQGTFTLLEAARKIWLEERRVAPEKVRFHHISTDEVYGELAPHDPAFNELTPYAPNSPYAASKAASDHLVRAYARTYGLPTTITNCSNNYGPFQFPEKLVPLIILNALEGRPLPVYGDGKQVRDWLYVDDHCDAILTVLRRGFLDQTYNIGGQNQPTNLEVVRLICQLLDQRLPNSPSAPHAQLIHFVADRPGHDRRYAMDIDKIQRQLGWRPQDTLASGMGKTIDWYLEHPDWIAAIRQRPSYQHWLEENYQTRSS